VTEVLAVTIWLAGWLIWVVVAMVIEMNRRNFHESFLTGAVSLLIGWAWPGVLAVFALLAVLYGVARVVHLGIKRVTKGSDR